MAENDRRRIHLFHPEHQGEIVTGVVGQQWYTSTYADPFCDYSSHRKEDSHSLYEGQSCKKSDFSQSEMSSGV